MELFLVCLSWLLVSYFLFNTPFKRMFNDEILIPTAKEIKEDNKPYPQHLSQKSQILVNHMNAFIY